MGYPDRGTTHHPASRACLVFDTRARKEWSFSSTARWISSWSIFSMRFFIDIDNLSVRDGRGFGSHISEISARLYSDLELEFGFSRTDSSSTLDMGDAEDVAIEVICKRISGAQRYDDPATVYCRTFFKSTPGADFIYTGNLDLSSPALQKILGVDTTSRAEQFSFRCVADVAKSLAGVYLDVPTSAATWKRAWFTAGGTGIAPGAETNVTNMSAVAVAENASAVAVATALAAAFAGDDDYTVSRIDAVVTFTATSTGRRADAHPRTTGFDLALLVAGSTAYEEPDVASVNLVVEIIFKRSTKVQQCKHFTLTVENSLYRPAQAGTLYGGDILTTYEIIDPDVAVALVSNANAENGFVLYDGDGGDLTVTTLKPDDDSGAGFDLGDSTLRWSNLYLYTGAVIDFGASGVSDVTITHSANLLTIAGGNVVIGDYGSNGTINGMIVSNVDQDGPAGSGGGLRISDLEGSYIGVVAGVTITALGSIVVNTGSSLTLDGHIDTSNGTGDGGYIGTYGQTAAGGNIDTHGTTGAGGHIYTYGATYAGGDIITRGGSAGAGGSINTSGDSFAAGGSIDTSNGGGSINTKGVGLLELGTSATRTSLVGQAVAPITVTLPISTTTLVGRDTVDVLTSKTLTSAKITTGIEPTSDDGAALGTTSKKFSDLFLASGAVLNFNNGNFTVTHSSGTLTFSGAVALGSATIGGSGALYNNYTGATLYGLIIGSGTWYYSNTNGSLLNESTFKTLILQNYNYSNSYDSIPLALSGTLFSLGEPITTICCTTGYNDLTNYRQSFAYSAGTFTAAGSAKHYLRVGDAVEFFTLSAGSVPSAFMTSTTYYVVATNESLGGPTAATTLQLASTRNGAAITSGTDGSNYFICRKNGFGKLLIPAGVPAIQSRRYRLEGKGTCVGSGTGTLYFRLQFSNGLGSTTGNFTNGFLQLTYDETSWPSFSSSRSHWLFEVDIVVSRVASSSVYIATVDGILFLRQGSYSSNYTLPLTSEFADVTSIGTTNTSTSLNKTSHGFSQHDVLRFSDTATPPTPFSKGVDYFVYSVVDANNYTLSLLPNGNGGAAITATQTTTCTMRKVGVRFDPTVDHTISLGAVVSTGSGNHAINTRQLTLKQIP